MKSWRTGKTNHTNLHHHRLINTNCEINIYLNRFFSPTVLLEHWHQWAWRVSGLGTLGGLSPGFEADNRSAISPSTRRSLSPCSGYPFPFTYILFPLVFHTRLTPHANWFPCRLFTQLRFKQMSISLSLYKWASNSVTPASTREWHERN